jgi:hypothetical protein
MKPIIGIDIIHKHGNRYLSEVEDEEGRLIVQSGFKLDLKSPEHERWQAFLDNDASSRRSGDAQAVQSYGNLLSKYLFGLGTEIEQELGTAKYQTGVTFQIFLRPSHPQLWQLSWEYLWNKKSPLPYLLRNGCSIQRIAKGLRRRPSREPS